jgi:putative acetyltransferase
LNLAQHSIRVVDPQGEDALSLLREAAIEARALYPELHTEGAPWPGNPSTPPGGTYVIAYELERPVACGALRPIDSATVEVRRMYVLKSARRSGLARKILVILEASAARMGYKVMCLETGSRQHPAMALYESFGFKRIAPFGEYVNDPTSICYEKAAARHADA